MLKEISKFTGVYKEFLKYLYINVFKKDKKLFEDKVGKLSDIIITIKAIEFLEVNNVPIAEALIFYNYKYPTASFTDKLKNLVLKEFYRIETKIECNYIPF